MPSRKREDSEPDSEPPEWILFATCRRVKKKYDSGRDLTGKEMKNILSNRLTKDAIKSFEGSKDETMNNLRFGKAWSFSKSKPTAESSEWRCDIFEDQPLGHHSEDSKEAFREVADRARRHSRPLLLYVHGYNNRIETPFQAAAKLQEKYKCEVIVFMWPTEGRFSGYDEDRVDARMSARPFLRFLAKSQDYLYQANNRQTVSLMCHSMGNYVLENAILDTSINQSRIPDLREGKNALGVSHSSLSLFQNIILTAADVD